MTPGSNCPAGTTLTNSSYDSADPKWGPFPVLCDLTVGLVVTDNSGATSAEATDTITVVPRTGKPFEHLVVTSDPDPDGNDPELGHLDPNARFEGQNTPLGQSLSTCPTRTKILTAIGYSESELCPGRTDNGVGNYFDNSAYSLDTVDSAGSPFDTFAYISNVNVTIPLTGVTNNTLGPTGEVPQNYPQIYAWNEANNARQYNAFLNAVNEHENFGVPGVAKSGHASTVQETIDANPKYDVDTYLEAQIARTSDALKNKAETILDTAEQDLSAATGDSVPGSYLTAIGTYIIYWWEPISDKSRPTYPGIWEPYSCTVGGPQSGCSPATDEQLRSNPPGPFSPGQKVQLNGGNFSPGENVGLDAHSQTEHLGDTTALSDGSISATVAIPADLAPGDHTITATGATTGIVATLNFTVQPLPQDTGDGPGGAGVDSGSGGSGSGSSGVASAPNSSPANQSTPLADTGSEINGTVAPAAILLIGGLGLVAVRRSRGRRRRS